MSIKDIIKNTLSNAENTKNNALDLKGISFRTPEIDQESDTNDNPNPLDSIQNTAHNFRSIKSLHDNILSNSNKTAQNDLGGETHDQKKNKDDSSFESKGENDKARSTEQKRRPLSNSYSDSQSGKIENAKEAQTSKKAQAKTSQNAASNTASKEAAEKATEESIKLSAKATSDHSVLALLAKVVAAIFGSAEVLLVVFVIFIFLLLVSCVLMNLSAFDEKPPESNKYNDFILDTFDDMAITAKKQAELGLQVKRDEVKKFAEANGFNVRKTLEYFDKNCTFEKVFGDVNWADPVVVFSILSTWLNTDHNGNLEEPDIEEKNSGNTSSVNREAVVNVARSAKGRIVDYYYGGKPCNAGFPLTCALNGGEKKVCGSWVEHPDDKGRRYAGLDCSGFVKWVFWTAGFDSDVYSHLLSTNSILAYGKTISENELLPGDIGLRVRKGGINHVGIYVGNGKFIHCSAGRGVVEEPYGAFHVFKRVVGIDDAKITPHEVNNAATGNLFDIYRGYISDSAILDLWCEIEYTAIGSCKNALEFKNIALEEEYDDDDVNKTTKDTYLEVTVKPYTRELLWSMVSHFYNGFSPHDLFIGDVTFDKLARLNVEGVKAQLGSMVKDNNWEYKTPWSQFIKHYEGCPIEGRTVIDETRFADLSRYVSENSSFSYTPPSSPYTSDGRSILEENPEAYTGCDESIVLPYLQGEINNQDLLMQNGYPVYKQYDNRWGNVLIVPSNPLTSIKHIGCTTSCLAMISSHYSGKYIPPHIFVLQHGAMFNGSGAFLWKNLDILASSYRFKVTSPQSGSYKKDLSAIISALEKGPCMFHVKGGGYSSNSSRSHYVLILGIDKKGRFIVNDPADSSGKRDWTVSKVLPYIERVWSFEKA